ncbi:20173_t:CDS:1 [Funneliformis geosporum]|nr:20173_t:CDS:1 [Funneliformis geosporum]
MPLDIDNLSLWTSNDFEELENILHDIIPHIRWFQIPAKIFWQKISLFEQIFPKQLYRDIIGYYIDPDASPSSLVLPQRHKFSLDSVLIDNNHFLVIASWIDKKDKSFYNSGNIPYSLKLLYRASRDGFGAEKFHELCDNKGSTIMISKLKENDKLIGGYNPLDWKPYDDDFSSDGKWEFTSDSFLFSFTSKNDINSGYIARVANNIEKQQTAVYYRSDVGPAFGYRGDLVIQNDNIFGTFSGHTYPEVKIIISMSKAIVDYEVFQVTNNETP